MAFYVNNDENAKEQQISDSEIKILVRCLISYSSFLKFTPNSMEKLDKLIDLEHLIKIFSPTKLTNPE